MTVFYFTATGNSLAVAKSIGGSLISIPQVVDSDKLHYKDDVIGIVFPIFWWNLPIIVRQFMDKATLEADYLFAIGTYGNIVGGAMVNIQKQARQKGYSFNYINTVRMVDNYLSVFDMEKQVKGLPKKNVPECIALIVSDINERKNREARAHIGTKALTPLLGRRFKPDKSALKYTVDDRCTTCGICAQVCPVKNIAVSKKVEFYKHCEGCMACLHLCPQTALHCKGEKNDKRWRHPDVSLKEIIEANNRL